MSISTITEPPMTDLPPPDALIAATFCLMTHHSEFPCVRVRAKIVEHLTLLRDHPHLAPDLRPIIARLAQRWLPQVRSASLAAPGSAHLH